jgi:hypothetical protein
MRGQRNDINNSPEAFLQKVKDKCITNKNGCWLWQGSTNQRGRPQVSWKAKYGLVYRYTYEAYYGKPIKEGLYGCHTCDEKTCCNPEHIFEGTNQDNQLDYIEKHGEIKNGWNTGGDCYVDGRKKINLKLQVPNDISDEKRFEWYKDKYCNHEDNGCWIWLREVGQDGYGRVRYKQRKHQTHRLMWMLANNKTPEDLEQLKKDGLVIGHMCPVEGPPNKACCNPDHLKIRTRSENAYDTRAYSKSKKDIHKDEEILEWLWIYDFVVNELGEDHPSLITSSGTRAHNFIYKGLFSLGLVSDGIKLDYVRSTLSGKNNKQFHKEFFDWTPSWK